jgi:hypothetical protein
MRNIMKKIIAIATLVAATSASAGFFNNGNGYNSSNIILILNKLYKCL